MVVESSLVLVLVLAGPRGPGQPASHGRLDVQLRAAQRINDDEDSRQKMHMLPTILIMTRWWQRSMHVDGLPTERKKNVHLLLEYFK
jgi:hypothetical protein